jgi:hypothetical protein
MTEPEDDFFARLRQDAAPLRHRPDEATLARIRARIQERLHEHMAPQPTVAELIASWFRPLAAAVAVLAIIAGVGLTTIEIPEGGVAIVVGGETYIVGD